MWNKGLINEYDLPTLAIPRLCSLQSPTPVSFQMRAQRLLPRPHLLRPPRRLQGEGPPRRHPEQEGGRQEEGGEGPGDQRDQLQLFYLIINCLFKAELGTCAEMELDKKNAIKSFFGIEKIQKYRKCPALIQTNLNPFHPDCKTVFLLFSTNIQVYFSIFLPKRSHIKFTSCSTLRTIKATL